MDNSFGQQRITLTQEVSELKKRLEELNRLKDCYEQALNEQRFTFAFRNSYSITKNKNTIEENLNERFVLGLDVNKKFFDEKDCVELINKVLLQTDESGEIEIEQRKVIAQSILEQLRKIKDEIQKYTIQLENYENDPKSSKAIDGIHDLYVQHIFDQKVIGVAKRIENDLPKTKESWNDRTFYSALINNSEYKRIREFYENIATQEKRIDFLNKLNNTSILDDLEIITVNDERINNLLKKEKFYQDEWKENMKKTEGERGANGIAENQNHDYSWRIELTKPTFLLKDEKIDAPDFKGKITVENLGKFVEESLFTKRKRQKEKSTDIDTDVLKTLREYELGRYETFNEDMSDYYYQYEPVKTLSDQIYRVTKTDEQGRIQTRIVFSPVTQQDVGKKVSLDFLKNIYFSNYMLDIAKKNGGYIGQIEVSPEKTYISNRYNMEQISSAVLFDKGINGEIVDCRGAQKRTYFNATKKDFLRLINGRERFRENNE